MSMITCKPGVRLRTLSPALVWIFRVLDRYVRSNTYLPMEIVITSINDGEHLPTSRHYSNEAIDIRSINFDNPKNKERFRSELEHALNSDSALVAPVTTNRFRVLLENPGANTATTAEHFHIQVAKGKTFSGA